MQVSILIENCKQLASFWWKFDIRFASIYTFDFCDQQLLHQRVLHTTAVTATRTTSTTIIMTTTTNNITIMLIIYFVKKETLLDSKVSFIRNTIYLFNICVNIGFKSTGF